MRGAGLLAAGIAHNFNNLLQAILGQASLLEMQSTNEVQVTRAAGIINDAATKGASLVKQLLSFASLEEPNKEVCDINAVIERGADGLRRQLRASQTLVVSLGEDLPRANVDPRQILRIITGLVNNAREAMQDNGEVKIFTDSISIQSESPHYEVPYGDYIRIGVGDNGIGMDTETRRRCFEPFFTTKDVDPKSGLSMSGAGLGLAAAFALARKNGGRLVADSRRGHGSVFTIYVPVAEKTQTVVKADLDDSDSEDPSFLEQAALKVETHKFSKNASKNAAENAPKNNRASISAIKSESTETNGKSTSTRN